MKLSAIALTIFLGVVSAFGQSTPIRVNPTTLDFESVPPNESPAKMVAVTNQTGQPMTVQVTLGSPFVLIENRCANGIKPHTHCNLYVGYQGSAVGAQDAGQLEIDYYGQVESGAITVALTGEGVASIPYKMKLRPAPAQCLKVHIGDPVTVMATWNAEDRTYGLPVGESVDVSCTVGQTVVDLGEVGMTTCQSHCPYGGEPYGNVTVTFAPMIDGKWECQARYGGDGLYLEGIAGMVITVGEGYQDRKCGY